MSEFDMNISLDDIESAAEGLGYIGTALSGVVMVVGAVIGIVKLFAGE